MWSNYHSHSKYCDGKGELFDYIVAAQKNNVFSMGFSSHAPVPFDCRWTMKKENLPLYLEEVDHLKNTVKGIEIYKSLEIDFIPGIVSPFDYKDELDYLLGSIHFVDKFPDGRPWEIDGPHTAFLEGLNTIFKGNFKDAMVRYLELTREMIFASAPAIIGHLDKMKIQNVDGKYFNESDTWYKDEMMKTIKLIEQAGLIVEVNTRGIYQKKSTTTYPGPLILELLRDKKIPIMINSDAHHPDDLVNQFTSTAALLIKLGFKTVSVMLDGQWKQLPFNQDGIIR
jgi:histidinol-phosphatase (PHP family)